MKQDSRYSYFLLFILFLMQCHVIAALAVPVKTKPFSYAETETNQKKIKSIAQKSNHKNYKQIKLTQNTITESPTKKEVINGIKILLLIITLAFCFEDKTIVPRMIAQDAVSFLSHELGHALTAKLLWNNPISIGLGASQPSKTKPLFKTKYFTLESWYPAGGYSRSIKPQKLNPQTGKMVLDKKKQAIMLLAGGIFGALGHIICNTINTYYVNNPVTHPCSFKNICYDYGVAEQLLENVIIPNNPNDGFKNDIKIVLEDCCNIKTPVAIQKIHPYIMLLVWGVHLIKNCNTDLRKEKEFFVRKLLQLICIPDQETAIQK